MTQHVDSTDHFVSCNKLMGKKITTNVFILKIMLNDVIFLSYLNRDPLLKKNF